MGNIEETNIKNQAYYFFNDMINIEDFDSCLLKIDTNWYKYISIYNGYVTIKKIDDYEKIHGVNTLYLMIGKVIGHIEEKKWKLIFSFWFNGIGFYKWKQRNI